MNNQKKMRSDNKKDPSLELNKASLPDHLNKMTIAVHEGAPKKDLNSIGGFFKELLTRFQKSDTPGMAAQLAYFFLLSLFPLLIFLITLVPYLPISQEEMLSLFEEFAPGETMTLIESTISEVVSSQSTGLLSIGILGTLWSASNGMNALTRSFNHAYGVDETRSFIVARGMAIVWTIAMITVVIIALLLPVFGKQIGEYLFSAIGYSEEFISTWNVLRFAITPFVLLLIFIGLYAFAPNIKIRFISVLPGAVFAALGWALTSFAFSLYVGNFGNYTSTYGSIGGIIVLMIWLYLSGMIIMIGGQINAIMAERKRQNA
ncbi:YihY/virulence factor BrkB family protein [Jeotgalibacillus soli]|uniref:Ribonuclease yfkH n=1 Tax=Jeotgalibacillus soli TaxID=889306 RepID=A0A0C2RZI8_9BACL|nr:YihY/virulence factor BrkB family protein [Jeotgalibacillus soli]KIL47224.1 ribonuclease yfkH [Jeotgalibacillus soli]